MKKRWFGMILALFMVLGILLQGISIPVFADELTDVITAASITDTAGNPLTQPIGAWKAFRINANYSLPNNTVHAGDTTTITLPAGIVAASPFDFQVKDGNDVIAVYETFKKAVEHVRAGNGPVLVESITYRWFGHSSSDPGKYRTKEEVDSWKKKDPLLKFEKYLIENKIATKEELNEIEEKSKKKIEDAVEFAKNSPEPSIESAFEDIYAD